MTTSCLTLTHVLDVWAEHFVVRWWWLAWYLATRRWLPLCRLLSRYTCGSFRDDKETLSSLRRKWTNLAWESFLVVFWPPKTIIADQFFSIKKPQRKKETCTYDRKSNQKQVANEGVCVLEHGTARYVVRVRARFRLHVRVYDSDVCSTCALRSIRKYGQIGQYAHHG